MQQNSIYIAPLVTKLGGQLRGQMLISNGWFKKQLNLNDLLMLWATGVTEKMQTLVTLCQPQCYFDQSFYQLEVSRITSRIKLNHRNRCRTILNLKLTFLNFR